jgi:endoglucanase
VAPLHKCHLCTDVTLAPSTTPAPLQHHSSTDPPSPAPTRSSGSFLDDLSWGAAWLYAATKNDSYLTSAQDYWLRHQSQEQPWGDWGFNWDNVAFGTTVLLYKLTGDDKYASYADSLLDPWLKGNKGVMYTPKGFAWANDWGSLRFTGNAALMAQIYSLYRRQEHLQGKTTCFAMKQLRYMAGETGRSFIVGTGSKPPCRVHHRAASCPPPPQLCDCTHFVTSKCNPHMLYGALVGGPGKDDSYEDTRPDYQRNEVALDYNAGLSGALAGLLESSWTWQHCVSSGYVNAAGAAPAPAVAAVVLLAVVVGALLVLV